MTRVLMVSRFDPFEPRPQPIQILSTAIGLSRAGADVTVVMDLKAGRRDVGDDVAVHLGQALGDGLDLRLVRGRHPGIRGLRRRLLLTRLSRRPWDGVLSRDFKLTPLLARMGLDVVHEWHSVPSALGQTGEREERAAVAAVAHIFVSRGLRGFVSERFPRSAGPALVLPNGCFCDPPAAESRLAALETAHKVIVAGLFRQPTDAELLVSVAESLPPDLRLVVAGAAPEALARSARVSALGTVPPAQVPSLLDGALCQLALYRRDLNTEVFASPMKVVAALASGVPLIATDLPTVRDLTGSDAVLVEPGEVDAVVTAVRRLSEDRRRARLTARGALQRATPLDWVRRGRSLITFLESLRG